MSFAAPFGSFLTTFDTAITTAQTTAVSGLATAMQAPLASMAVIYFAFMGWRVARGDLALVHDFTVHMAKIGFIFYMATNLTAYNKWVVGTYEQGIPNAIATAIASTTGQASSVSGVAGSLDQVWGMMWQMASSAWASAGMLDVSTRVVAAVSVLVGGVGILACAGVYLISRFLFAVIIIFGPVTIACAMFSSTRPIFERWIGKGVALIVLQVAAVVTMQIVLTGDQTFMAPLVSSAASATAGVGIATQLQNLIAMALWVCMGAVALYSLPTIAYSIGAGVSVSMVPVAMAAIAAVQGAIGAASGAAGAAGSALAGGGGGSAPEYNLSLARGEIGHTPDALGYDPPPALTYASSST